MLFNSFEFAVFLPIVFLLYWFVFDYAIRRCRRQVLWQNLFVVAASYVFYGWWDWRFLLLIAFTTLCSFASGIGIEKAKGRGKRAVMVVNIVINLLILGLYKYYDFFVESFAQMFGVDGEPLLLHLILPVGISFYTFQALSYSIDVYRGKVEATHDIAAFAAFISFFPLLVAGPIERATNLLPQFQQKRRFDYSQAVDGMRQILWGLFKKIVVADNCATYVDTVWADYGAQSGSTLVLAAVLFSIQIYGDFSGYSDIALGASKLFGIQAMRNFNVPYFSRDIAEFWRRWHISLTTWFRDYVYIPLGGSRPVVPESVQHPEAYKKAVIIRNTFVIFLLSGFWHGANWTFVLWGAYHALLFIPLILLGRNRRYRDTVAEGRVLPNLREVGQMVGTFALAAVGWVIFRADDINSAFQYLTAIPQRSLLSVPWLMNRKFYVPLMVSILLLFVVEWCNRANGGTLTMRGIQWKPIRWAIYLAIIFMIAVFGDFEQEQFIYFQF